MIQPRFFPPRSLAKSLQGRARGGGGDGDKLINGIISPLPSSSAATPRLRRKRAGGGVSFFRTLGSPFCRRRCGEGRKTRLAEGKGEEGMPSPPFLLPPKIGCLSCRCSPRVMQRRPKDSFFATCARGSCWSGGARTCVQ